MGNKYSRSGGKFGGTHTTFVPLAAKIADICDRCEFVERISAGFITSGRRSPRGGTRVRIKQNRGGLLLVVRDNIAIQHIQVYGKKHQNMLEAITQACVDAGIQVV